jgi:hypothetical protein
MKMADQGPFADNFTVHHVAAAKVPGFSASGFLAAALLAV